MNKRCFDFSFCHFPLLLGIPVVILSKSTNDLENFPVAQVITAIVYGGGWIISLIYGFYRLSNQKFSTKRTILWVLALLWVSMISLPWLYWKHLKNDHSL